MRAARDGKEALSWRIASEDAGGRPGTENAATVSGDRASF
jgi:hypothetical protein